MSEAAVIARGVINGSRPSAAGSVLIIDDEAAIRESLQTLLELEGFEIETAASGEDGLAQMADRPFDLVLLDLLCGESGFRHSSTPNKLKYSPSLENNSSAADRFNMQFMSFVGKIRACRHNSQ